MSADPEEEENSNMSPNSDPPIIQEAVPDEADLAELEDVNVTLDELSTALDFFEYRADSMIAQLKELLHSNREIRQQLAQENAAAALGEAQQK